MLIDFSVTNFRSIKQKQTLSMVAAEDDDETTDSGQAAKKGLEETNTFPSGLEKLPRLLRSAVIYGANASGKTNVVRALYFMGSFIISSFKNFSEGESIRVKPFLFDTESAKLPSEFEITFMIEGIRYQYGFAATTERIMEEWLFSYPEGKTQRWFERAFDNGSSSYKYRFGRKFTGQKKIIETATRQNALFLSTAIQLNDDQLKPVYNWFLNTLEVFPDLTRIISRFTWDYLESESSKSRILSFLKAADTGISDIVIERRPFNPDMLPPSIDSNSSLREQIIKDLKDKVVITDFKSIHDSGISQITLDFEEDESNGTKKLFDLSGLWFDVISKGKVLVVDELDTSLHPLLLRTIVDMFHDPKSNSHNAQLIFNTHDTTLLDPDIYRRDQIWFTEKDRCGATSLYSLVEFIPKKNEALERGYLNGRYGAIPFIGDFEF
ncbi:MAG: ATP-binding protein [Nitrospirae bacterium]|nr:ATP-binding protein [Nitrospirota bacterium]